uniref:Glutathione synthetase n=1 Tax=Globodera rostochiensis TaxID=31243 RepID=A0A914H9Z2_GLORO
MHYFISTISFIFLFYVPTATASVDKNDDTFLAFVKGDPNQNNEVLIQMYEARLGLMYLMRENWKCDKIRKEIKKEEKEYEECEKLRKYLDILYEYLFQVYTGPETAADQIVKPMFKHNDKNVSGKEVLISSQHDELNSSTNYTDILTTFLQRDDAKTQLLIKEAKDWAQNIELIIREPKFDANLSRWFYQTVVAPFTLFPSPFPRKFFEQAANVQTALNLLYFRIMRDYPFLKEVYQKLIKNEQPLSSALQIMEEIHLEGIKQPLTVLFQRADYMLCESNYEGNEKPSFELKQIEVNGSAIGGLGYSTRTSKLHRQILSKTGLNLSNSVENNTSALTVEAIYQAWQKFGDPKAIIIFIFDEAFFAYYERIGLYFELADKFEGKTEIIALNLKQCAEFLKLDPHDFTLRYDDKIVAVVFNQDNMLSTDPKKMESRRTIERSTAIKAPSLAAALAHTKKVQQVLAKPGMVERFFPNPEEAPLIEAIRKTYANLWTIEEDDNNEYPQIIEEVKKDPHKFVLKKIEYAQYQNRNLARIYFEQEILKSMTNFTPIERSAYILMEKLQPTIVKNHIVKTMFDENMNVPPSIFEDVTPELGIFGTLLGNIVDGKVLHNVQLGHQMKTKLASENEGGIARGKSAYDSAYLID